MIDPTVKRAVADGGPALRVTVTSGLVGLVYGSFEAWMAPADARKLAAWLIKSASTVETCGLSCGPGHGEPSKNGGQPADTKGNPPLS